MEALCQQRPFMLDKKKRSETEASHHASKRPQPSEPLTIGQCICICTSFYESQKSCRSACNPRHSGPPLSWRLLLLASRCLPPEHQNGLYTPEKQSPESQQRGSLRLAPQVSPLCGSQKKRNCPINSPRRLLSSSYSRSPHHQLVVIFPSPFACRPMMVRVQRFGSLD